TPPDFRDARAPLVTSPGTAIRSAIAAGRFADAAEDYFGLPSSGTRGVLDGDEALALARWLRSHGHPDAALTVVRRALRDARTGAESAPRDLLAGQILLEDLGEPAQAFQHLRAVLDDAPDPETARAAR